MKMPQGTNKDTDRKAELSAEQLYGDILNLPHPVSRRHPPMSLLNRAAQFAPFAALTGYGAAIEETARQTDDAVELDAGEIDVLNEKLMRLRALLPQKPKVQLTWFVPDERKAGGAYRTIEGIARKIDPIEQVLVLDSGERVPLNRMIDLKVDGENDI